MVLAFDMLPLSWRVWVELSILKLKQILLKELTRGKLVSWWHVPLIVHACHHLTILGKNSNFWGNWVISKKYNHLAIPNFAQLVMFKAFFHS